MRQPRQKVYALRARVTEAARFTRESAVSTEAFLAGGSGAAPCRLLACRLRAGCMTDDGTTDYSLFLPTPPGSPRRDTGPPAAASEGGEVAPEMTFAPAEEEWGAQPAKAGGIQEAMRSLPFWMKLISFEGDTNFTKVSTRYTKNLCLMFSVLVSSGELKVDKQKTQYVLSRCQYLSRAMRY